MKKKMNMKAMKKKLNMKTGMMFLMVCLLLMTAGCSKKENGPQTAPAAPVGQTSDKETTAPEETADEVHLTETETPAETEEETIAPETEEVETEEAEEDDDEAISPEFKASVDSYEAFFDEYCDFLEEFAEDPNDLGLLARYTQFLLQYEETMEEWEAMENEDMNDAELAYYLEANLRIEKRLLETAELVN